jgi:hypothetical protein
MPSVEIDVGYCGSGLLVNRSTVPVLSAACQNRFGGSARCDAKMMRRLSSVQTGYISRAGASVRRVSV